MYTLYNKSDKQLDVNKPLTGHNIQDLRFLYRGIEKKITRCTATTTTSTTANGHRTGVSKGISNILYDVLVQFPWVSQRYITIHF